MLPKEKESQNVLNNAYKVAIEHKAGQLEEPAKKCGKQIESEYDNFTQNQRRQFQQLLAAVVFLVGYIRRFYRFRGSELTQMVWCKSWFP